MPRYRSLRLTETIGAVGVVVGVTGFVVLCDLPMWPLSHAALCHVSTAASCRDSASATCPASAGATIFRVSGLPHVDEFAARLSLDKNELREVTTV